MSRKDPPSVTAMPAFASPQHPADLSEPDDDYLDDDRGRGVGRDLREGLLEELGEHAHVKVIWDKVQRQQRMIVYCRCCRTASIVSFHRHEIVAMWNEHVGGERHARRSGAKSPGN